MTKIFDLAQTLTPLDIRRLVDFQPIALPRLLIHDAHTSRPMTTLLANTKYICLIPNWAQLFDKLKRTLTCAAVIW